LKKQKYPHLLGSKWTATETTFGWRHFRVLNRKNEAGMIFAEMGAACDPNVRFWINAKTLKQRQLWRAGWQPLQAEAAASPENSQPAVPEPANLETGTPN
jgi:tryptophan-rich hypothetical protein